MFLAGARASGLGGCSDGREEAEGWTLLQQHAFLPAGQAFAPPLGFRVNTYWKGQNNIFPAIGMEMLVAMAGFPRGGVCVCVSVDMSCGNMAPQGEVWPGAEQKREAECGSSWLWRR